MVIKIISEKKFQAKQLSRRSSRMSNTQVISLPFSLDFLLKIKTFYFFLIFKNNLRSLNLLSTTQRFSEEYNHAFPILVLILPNFAAFLCLRRVSGAGAARADDHFGRVGRQGGRCQRTRASRQDQVRLHSSSFSKS